MDTKSKHDLTPRVFCDVTAVIAVIAYEPNAVTVLISACIPAPPEESDPAMINIFELGFNLFNSSSYYINTFLKQYSVFRFSHNSNLWFCPRFSN